MSFGYWSASCMTFNAECSADDKRVWLDGRLYLNGNYPKNIEIGDSTFRYESRTANTEYQISGRPDYVIYRFLYRRVPNATSIAKCIAHVHSMVCMTYGVKIADHAVYTKYKLQIEFEIEGLMSDDSIASLILFRIECDIKDFFKE